jgi:predicted membrane metal-binding protein
MERACRAQMKDKYKIYGHMKILAFYKQNPKMFADSVLGGLSLCAQIVWVALKMPAICTKMFIDQQL